MLGKKKKIALVIAVDFLILVITAAIFTLVHHPIGTILSCISGVCIGTISCNIVDGIK